MKKCFSAETYDRKGNFQTAQRIENHQQCKLEKQHGQLYRCALSFPSAAPHSQLTVPGEQRPGAQRCIQMGSPHTPLLQTLPLQRAHCCCSLCCRWPLPLAAAAAVVFASTGHRLQLAASSATVSATVACCLRYFCDGCILMFHSTA